MGKNRALLVVNPLLVLALLFQAATGLLNDRLGEEFFARAHPLGGYAIILLGITHLVLNWSWVKTNLLKRKHAMPKPPMGVK